MTKRNKVAAQGKKHKVGSPCLVLNRVLTFVISLTFSPLFHIGRFSRWQTEEGKYGRQEEIL